MHILALLICIVLGDVALKRLFTLFHNFPKTDVAFFLKECCDLIIHVNTSQ